MVVQRRGVVRELVAALAALGLPSVAMAQAPAAYPSKSIRDALAPFLRYHHEQGLSKPPLQPKELFAPETMESFKI